MAKCSAEAGCAVPSSSAPRRALDRTRRCPCSLPSCPLTHPPLCPQTHQERNRLSPEPAGPCPQRACTFVTPWATSKAPCTSFLPDLASAIQVRRTVALLLTAGALNEPMTNTDGVWSSVPLLGHQDPEPFANSGEINSVFGNTGAT